MAISTVTGNSRLALAHTSTLTGNTRLHWRFAPMSRISGKIETLKPSGKIEIKKAEINVHI